MDEFTGELLCKQKRDIKKIWKIVTWKYACGYGEFLCECVKVCMSKHMCKIVGEYE